METRDPSSKKKSDLEETKSEESNVLDFDSFRRKKIVEQDLARGRKPLYLSHLDGKMSGSPHLKSPGEGSEDFGDRVNRIRSSLDRINRLMSELKKMSQDYDKQEADEETEATKK